MNGSDQPAYQCGRSAQFGLFLLITAWSNRNLISMTSTSSMLVYLCSWHLIDTCYNLHRFKDHTKLSVWYRTPFCVLKSERITNVKQTWQSGQNHYIKSKKKKCMQLANNEDIDDHIYAGLGVYWSHRTLLEFPWHGYINKNNIYVKMAIVK